MCESGRREAVATEGSTGQLPSSQQVMTPGASALPVLSQGGCSNSHFPDAKCKVIPAARATSQAQWHTLRAAARPGQEPGGSTNPAPRPIPLGQEPHMLLLCAAHYGKCQKTQDTAGCSLF